MCACVHMHVYMRVCACVYIYIYVCVCVSLCMCLSVCLYACAGTPGGHRTDSWLSFTRLWPSQVSYRQRLLVA